MEATEEIERLRLEKEIASQAEIEAIQAFEIVSDEYKDAFDATFEAHKEVS